jgi:hypothetical protein
MGYTAGAQGMELEQLMNLGSGPVWLFYLTFGVFNSCWIALYVLAIRRGFLDQTFAIPFVALAINMAWDVIGFTLAKGPALQRVADMFYYGLQLVILYQVVRFGWRDFPVMSRRMFLFWIAFSQVAAVWLMGLVMADLRDPIGVKTGFIDTFINSALFIAMFYRRSGLEGQTIYIGLLKLVGTGIMSLSLALFPWPGYADSALLLSLYVGIFVLDLVYVLLVYQRAQQTGISVWRRW